VFDDVADVFLYFRDIEVEHGLNRFNVLVNHLNETFIITAITLEIVSGGQRLFKFAPCGLYDIALEILPELRDDET
jgi:hypothetical protein